MWIWWLTYAISCFRVFAPLCEKRRHENMSFFVTSTLAFRREDTKTRQTKGDKTKDFYPPKRNFQQTNFRALVISPSIFRVFVSSPRKSKVKVTTNRHVSCFLDLITISITLLYYLYDISLFIKKVKRRLLVNKNKSTLRKDNDIIFKCFVM